MRRARRLTAVWLIAALCGCGSDNSAPLDEALRPDGDDGFDAGLIKVEQTRLIYLPDQTGGAYHTALVLIHNAGDKVAVDVSGQISVKDEAGQLVKSFNPTSVTVLPGEQGLLQGEALDLPKPVPAGSLDVQLSVGSALDPPDRSPVTFSEVRYERGDGGFESCKVTGTVSNTFTQPKDDLQLRVAMLSGGKLASGGFTYVDQVFPATDATFDVDFVSPSECPQQVDQILVLPNLGQDKITNP